MASHLNPPNRQSHVCNFNQLIHDIRYAGITRLLSVKVEIYKFSTLPTSSCGLLLPPAVAFGPERLVTSKLFKVIYIDFFAKKIKI